MGKRRGKKPNKSRDNAYVTDIDKKNDLLVAYYKAQNIVPEDEWDALMDSLQTILPISFRLAGSRQTARSLNASIMSHYIPHLRGITFEEEEVPPPTQIPWYPDGLAWQFNVSKKVLRKHPDFKKFHSFLVYETEGGNISRQETVSMIPPLFLGVEPHHKTLDMCAAPGSKTAQLLEALHADDSPTNPVFPSGIVVANDSDYKRTHMLIHQAGRLPSPAFLVTNVDAALYPGIKVPSPGSTELRPLLFDRILADVPCSGDGTLRKNLGIWKSWQPGDGNGLHGLQIRILHRAMRLLAPGGRIVYSTCSLNPVENEAVIAAALKANPSFHLVDVSNHLPSLKRRSGLTTWIPAVNKTMKMYKTFAEYKEKTPAQEAQRAKLVPTHWPPEDAESLNLGRCMRIYPHLQDTGGFFVAVLERVPTDPPVPADVKEEAKEGPLAAPLQSSGVSAGAKREAEDDAVDTVETKKPKLTTDIPAKSEATEPSTPSTKTPGSTSSFKEDPFTYLSSSDPVISYCKTRLNLTSDFPTSNVLVRNPHGTATRSVYVTTDFVKSIIQSNDYAKIRLTAAGTKVFTKQEAGRGFEAQFRILGEGLSVVLPFLDPTTIESVSLEVLKVLLSTYYPLFTSFSADFQKVLETKQNGSLIIRIPKSEFADPSLAEDIVVPLWKSQASISLMIDKKAKSAMSLRLFGEDISPNRAEQPAPDKKEATDGGQASKVAEEAGEDGEALAERE